jgi:membrane protein GlpM
MMELVWKGTVGGLVTALIVWLSKRGDTLPGILPLFPTFAVIALIVVGAKGELSGFKEAGWAGVKTIPAYLAFLIVCIFAVEHMDYRLAIAAGLVAWLAVAGAMFWGAKFI